MSKTSSAVKRRWNEKSYDRVTIVVPKGKKEMIRQYAEEHGWSVNGMLNEMLRYELCLTEKEWAVRARA